MKILFAEDDPISAYAIQTFLKYNNFDVTHVENGKKALFEYQGDNYDIVLTDWMMPFIDGIELTRKIRALSRSKKHQPIIIFLTSLNLPNAKKHALNAGADEYISKPTSPEKVIEIINKLVKKNKQHPKVLDSKKIKVNKIKHYELNYAGVFIGASTGGPAAIKKLFKEIPSSLNAAYFIVLHGPVWMLDAFSQSLQTLTNLKVIIAKNEMVPQVNHIYIAPGNKHLIIKSNPVKFELNNKPPINYVRPSIDPLFKSGSVVFKNRSIGIILTGMGCDGTVGAQYIKAEGGKIIAQNPKTSLVNSMPESVIKTKIVTQILDLENIPNITSFYVNSFFNKKNNE